MDNKQKPLTLKEKGYVRKKTITYTIMERVRPLKKKSKQSVQLSFPFPSETTAQPVKSSTETKPKTEFDVLESQNS